MCARSFFILCLNYLFDCIYFRVNAYYFIDEDAQSK